MARAQVYTLHPAPYTPHSTPCALHPTPYTLRSTPFTLHPAPYTLHPTSWLDMKRLLIQKFSGNEVDYTIFNVTGKDYAGSKLHRQETFRLKVSSYQAPNHSRTSTP